MKVLAVGAAGASAGLVVQALSARGVSVRGLVHSKDKQDAARANGATETVVADLNDRAALRGALDGVDGVFHIIPAFVPDEASTGTALVEVAAEAGIGRFVFSSVYHPSLTDLSNHRNKQPAEHALYDSSMNFTILQPAMFMAQLDGVVAQGRRAGVLSGPYSADSAMTYVDFRDVAEVAALAFTTAKFDYGTFELAAPGMFSRRQLAVLLTEILQRPVTAHGAAPSTAANQAPPAIREGLLRMLQHYDEVGFHGGNALVLTTMLGREPVTVPAYLAEVAKR